MIVRTNYTRREVSASSENIVSRPGYLSSGRRRRRILRIMKRKTLQGHSIRSPARYRSRTLITAASSGCWRSLPGGGPGAVTPSRKTNLHAFNLLRRASGHIRCSSLPAGVGMTVKAYSWPDGSVSFREVIDMEALYGITSRRCVPTCDALSKRWAGLDLGFRLHHDWRLRRLLAEFDGLTRRPRDPVSGRHEGKPTGQRRAV